MLRYVNTRLARRALPHGTALGGHSLAALYAEATGGGAFNDAHDALADDAPAC